jgi:glycosyltransferase involved in cell wall biosynthesis
MKIAIVHYHLQPGGVTRVIENTLQAWEENGTEIEAVALSGRAYPGDRLPDTRVVQGLDYTSPRDAVDPRVLTERLRASAKDALGQTPDLWHIHNHSLGKNPSLTAAVSLLAESGERILLHPHDFAEDGRPGNYLSLSEVYQRAYPTGHTIHYAALNQRDRGFLAHMLKDSSSRVHLLANAVPPSTPFSEFQEEKILDLPENLLLYPVRAVRRKNLGELALLASSHQDFHFANSLGPTNPEFTPIFEDWKQFGKELELPLTYGLGEHTDASFPEMVGHAQSILSVSVAEGFGLGFLEPWTFGKGLCGRNLPDITSDFAELGVSLANLYDRLPIPLDCIPSVSQVKATIQSALAQFYLDYQEELPEDGTEIAFQSMVENDCIDFGRLDERNQRGIIRSVAQSPELQQGIQKHSGLEVLSGEIIDRNRQAVTEQFSLSSYAERTLNIYQELLATDNGAQCQFANGQLLLDQYLSPNRLNLLRTS